MSIPSAVKSTPIGSRQQLVDYVAAGEKPRDAWRIGTEHEKFGFLTDAFKYGAPPHGGFAFGVDRLVMMLAGRDNLREVLAFPKVQNASCPMMETPSVVAGDQLEMLKIKLDAEDA